MRIIGWIGSSVTVVALLAPIGVRAEEKPVTGGTVAKEAREAVEATTQYTAQQKEAFQRKAQEELDAVQKQIAALQAKTTQASESVRMELKQSIQELEAKKAATRKQLEELQAATGSKWNDMKNHVHSAIEDLKQSYQKMRSNLP
jgi:DNA repair exonuclease SbcCD ATPase subunit